MDRLKNMVNKLPTQEAPEAEPSVVTVHDWQGQRGTEMMLSREEITHALQVLKQTTKAHSFCDALEMGYFKFDPDQVHRKNSAHVIISDACNLLSTLMRASLDGNTDPPLDLDAEYACIVGHSQAPGR